MSTGPTAASLANGLPLEALLALVKTEIDLATSLLQTVQQERQALHNLDTDTVGELGRRKQGLAQKLQTACINRDTLLNDWGYPAGSRGAGALLANHPHAGLAEAWQTLADLASQCREENRLVGIAVSRHLLVANQAVQILQSGGHATERLYAASGASTGGAPSNTLAKV